jgi:hypothetical protein
MIIIVIRSVSCHNLLCSSVIALSVQRHISCSVDNCSANEEIPFYVIRNFITDFIRTHPEPAHSNPYLYPVCVRLLSLLRLPSTPKHPTLIDVIQPIFSSPHVSHILSSCYILCPAYPSQCIRLGIIRWRVQIIKLLTPYFSLVLQ